MSTTAYNNPSYNPPPSTMQPMSTTASSPTRQTSQQIQHYSTNVKYPLPTTNNHLHWQHFTIPIPFIPIKRPIPLLFSACVLVLFAYWNGVLAIVGQDRQHLNQPNLSDVGHDWLGYTGNYTPYAHNIYIGVYGALTVIRFLPTRSFFWEIVRRFLFIWGILFFLRGCTDGLTQEPKTQYICHPPYIGDNVFGYGGKYIFGAARTCSDLMFSGHTIVFTLLTLQWTNYSTGVEFALCCASPRMPRWLQRFFLPTFTATGDVNSCTAISYLAWFTGIGGYLTLISDRAHYSVDVFVSVCITLAMYKLYLFYIKTVYDHSSWFSDFVIWFEGLTPPQPGQSTLSVMTCAGYSQKTTAALPPQWTWFDVERPAVYDIEAQRYNGNSSVPAYAQQQSAGASNYNTAAVNNTATESVADQHNTSQPFAGAVPLTAVGNSNGNGTPMSTASSSYTGPTVMGNTPAYAMSTAQETPTTTGGRNVSLA